ncbi:MAG: DUF1566 domain-containing protein [Candidatus Electrothrix sp. ATG1]|nr:DUF1566 domain-containing protein [Candidatus Electrothrix sp. ATG1]
MKKIILIAGLVAGGVALSVAASANNWLLYLPAILAGSGGGGTTEPPPPVEESSNKWLLYLPAILAGSQGGGNVDPPVVTGALNDTGITAKVGSTGEEDADYGRDADVATNSDTDGYKGFSFTEINSTCVLDNVTGLAWEVKTTENAGDTYKLATATTYAEETFAGCGGSYTCRLPTIKELLSIVSLGSPGNIDLGYFPNTAAATYLSGTKVANETDTESAKVWGVHFSFGWTSNLADINDPSYRVRAVCTTGGE